MILLFTSVDSENIARHTFDHLDTSKKKDCLEIYKAVREDCSKNGHDYHIYDLVTPRPHFCLSLYEFQEDYNDEDLDGGMWCFVLEALTDKDVVKFIEENA